MTATTPAPPAPDRLRWVALVVLSSSLFIIVLDNTVLNVAVPSIVKELDTDVSALQWVISGYSLVLASLLISLGRVGDIIGRRTLFLLGAGLFGIGSAIASTAESVVQLFIGESLLEGIGAAAMLPATLALISATFKGRERAPAFAVWGAVAGGAGALGPWLGGVLTTDYSWRWAFRINVVIAPLAIIAALLVVRESRDERSHGFDFGGVALVTAGLLGLVFGFIEAGRYGWLTPTGSTSVAGLSPVTLALAAGVVLLTGFVVLELRRGAAGRPVVFDVRDLVHPGFRYGLTNTLVLAMGEFGAFFVLPIFLQAGLHLSAIDAGTWLLIAGVAAFVGAGVGAPLSRRFGPKYFITLGLTLEACGIFGYVLAFDPGATFWSLAPGLVLHGLGIGFATSQLTSVVLSDIPPQKAGSASGAAAMVRQVGTALGIALIGAIYLSQATGNIRDGLAARPEIPAEVRDQIAARVADGIGGPPVGGGDPVVGRLISDGLIDAARPAVAFAGIVVAVGALLSLLVPNIPVDAPPGAVAAADERRKAAAGAA